MVLTLMATAPVHATVLYNQPYDGTGILYASQNDTNVGGFGNFATTYDNFTLASNSTITDVAWTGGYWGGSPAAISGFTIGFYSDNAGVPGALLLSDAFSGNGNENLFASPIATYSTTLGTAFSAAGGTPYWMSIQATIGLPPQWGWAEGTGGNGNAYEVFRGTGGATFSDMAFTLSGSTVPEPVTFLLAGSALLLLGSVRRRIV
jgi:hypothetical protein